MTNATCRDRLGFLTRRLGADLGDARAKHGIRESARGVPRLISSASVLLATFWIAAPLTSAYAGPISTDWLGGNGEWSDAAKWSKGRPGKDSFVTLSKESTAPGAVTLDIDSEIHQLTVRPDNTLLLNYKKPRTLTVTTSVTNATDTREGITIAGGSSLVIGNIDKKVGKLNNSGTFFVDGSTLKVGREIEDSGSLKASKGSTVTVGEDLIATGTLGVTGGSTLSVGDKLSIKNGEVKITDSTATASKLMGAGNPLIAPRKDNLVLNSSKLMVTGDASNDGGQIKVGIGTSGGATLAVDGKFTNENGSQLTIGSSTGSRKPNSVTVGKGFENSSDVLVERKGEKDFPGGGEFTVTTGNYTQTDGKTEVLGTLAVKAGMYVQAAGDTIIGRPKPKMVGATAITGDLTAKDGVDAKGGTLQGSASITSKVFKNGATVIPGFLEPKAKDPAAAMITITGNYQQQSAGTLDALFEGTAAGDWSVLDISGKAALAGTLNVIPINGFGFNESEIGDVFDIMNFAPGQLNGVFSTLELDGTIPSGSSSTMLNIGDNLALLVGYNAEDVTLTLKASIAPAPLPTLSPLSSLALLVVGLAGLDLIRRRPVG
jgi:hypothetical protein